jgi:glycosyltransferase involved in cell wall biosynthesis
MSDKISITWAVTVCNELTELTKLLNFLQNTIGEDDEILIQYDSGNVTDEVLEYLNIMDMMHENHKVVGFPLNGDFSSFKNNLTEEASKDYIIQIDADEIPHELFMAHIHIVLEQTPVDLVFIPRVNTVEGLTESHIQKWRWHVNERGWVNFPDYQTRIYKRTDDIKWMNKVHERITGYDTFSNLPAEEHWSFYHHKQIDRQEKQNEFYETL